MNVSKIAVNNNGGFDLYFQVEWQDGTNWQVPTWKSGTYPIDKSQTSPELGSIGVPNNSPVNVVVYAVLGKTKQGNQTVTYVAGSGTVATYIVSGGLDTYTPTLQQ